MQHDANAVGIDVAEVHERGPRQAVEQVANGRGVPAGHVDQEPAGRCRKVPPGPKVLHEECGPDRSLEGQAIEESPLGYRDLAQDGSGRAQINDPGIRSSRQPCGRPQPDRAVMGRVGLAQRTPAGFGERGFGVRRRQGCCGSTVDAVRQVGDAGGSLAVEELAEAIGRR